MSSKSPPPPNSSSQSPPPPSSSSKSSSPPPPSSSSKSPPSSSSKSNSPPPPSSSSKSPPPPSSSSKSKSPPPPDNNNNNNNNNKKSPPSPSNKNSHDSQPPPPPPPPPPSAGHHKALSPPHKSSSSDDSKSGSHSSNVRTKAIIGVVIGGGGLLLIVFTVCVVICCRRKKKQKQHDYYMDSGPAKRTDAYYGSGPSSSRMNPPPAEHRVDIHQSGSTGVSSEYRWSNPPPPPPPQFSSSEFSSAGFSGPIKPAMPPPHPALALGFNKNTFTYEELAAATGGFGKACLLGEGGFGHVYKGVLPNGKEIAVKSLKSGSGQGEREFQAEVEIISRVHHRHLVSLVGYSIAQNKRMLVYEFVPNGTLEHHLHGKGVAPMNWPLRIRTAIGSARGFAYLHEDCHPRIFHRDIKTSNILLDEHYEAKVADFGLAKLASDTFTHVSTRIMGTFGYLAPEYASTGKLTDKSDIYSYGVMLLELITGKRPVDVNKDDETLVDWARPILMRAVEGGSYDELVDPQLENNYNHDEMLRMVACAAACVRHSARRRPKMSQIVHALEGNIMLDHLNEGAKPGLGMYSSSSDADGSYSDLKKFSKPESTSQEFSSSGEHGHPAEY